MKTRIVAVVFVIALLAMTGAHAEVVARTDTRTVDLNESFTLGLEVDTHLDMEPDLTVLDAEFYRGQVSQVTNATYVNGDLTRSRTWSISLRPKITGTLTIPPIRVGNESSQPITIIVNEPTVQPPGEADVFIVSEVDQSEAFVQSQILYRIKIYRAVQVRQPTLQQPTIAGAEVLAEVAGEERSYEAILGGRAYQVNERVFALYPQESGEITISPARFEARVLRNGRITGRKAFDSDGHTVTVNPIPDPPADFPDAVWLPARDLQLSEEWSRDRDTIDAGEPLTRHVTISALGQLETQIPASPTPEIDGMNVYSDNPDLSRQYEADGIRGVRKDHYVMIGVRGGAVEIPELVIPWWDIDVGEWREARLPARTIEVRAVAPVVEAVAEETPIAPSEDAEPQAPVSDNFWKLTAQILGAGWLLTLLLWSLSSPRRGRVERKPDPPPIYKQQAKFIKAARRAAKTGDVSAVKDALLEWGRLEWPQDAPRSLGGFADRVAEPLATELRNMSAATYGANGTNWNADELMTALRKITPLRDQEKEAAAAHPLPPLMPPT